MRIFNLRLTFGGMASKGERSDYLSDYNKFDAGDDLRILLNPILAIPLVMRSCFFSLIYFGQY